MLYSPRLASIWAGVRHAAVVAKTAWQLERQRPPLPRRRRDEIDFLPAALEVLETPASPTARITLLALTALLVIGLAWSFIGRLDVVAIADGRTIPAGKTKVIQPLETGVVRAIHVRDGQSVKTGDVLVELDPTSAGADMRRLIADLVAARADAARLDAALHPDEPMRHFKAPPGTPRELVELQRAWLANQADEHMARLAGLDAERERREAEYKSVEVAIHRLEQAIPLLRQRTNARTELADKGFGSRLTALELQQQLVEMEHEQRGLRFKREEAQAALQAIRRQRQQVQSEYLRDVRSQRNETMRKVSSLEEEVLKAEQRHDLQTLAAPLDGVVQQLAIHTIGGVVTPAQPLLAIVPDGDGLEAEIMLQNRDIGFIQPGQGVEIKLETFLFTKYGTIPGRVASVSRDAVPDEKRGLIYPARISLDRAWIDVDGQRFVLGAGMALTAEIKTDQRRFIDYLLSPIMRYRDESMRER
ncbi:HlyD family type I secretion periplasmic adaptor subunit [Ferrovibrio sp.]|uniref:HlyD family type I secretion periplasmic adaptor subunit n=1 Tax=Ferrovibrio sp. TaxID=1917215 RepID=UPI0026158F25|nr:HlyD family type I secretion periplasmic adaptor subunit [Ferrovibrio sp.]